MGEVTLGEWSAVSRQLRQPRPQYDKGGTLALTEDSDPYHLPLLPPQHHHYHHYYY